MTKTEAEDTLKMLGEELKANVGGAGTLGKGGRGWWGMVGCV